MTKSETKFSIDVGSDQGHDRLVADIYFNGQYICSVTEEKGPGQFDFEINSFVPGVETIQGVRCPLEGLLDTIQRAAERLKRMKDRE